MPSATIFYADLCMKVIKDESYYGMFRARAPGMIFCLIWCAEIELLIYLNLFIYNNYLRSRSWNNGSIISSATNINIVVFMSHDVTDAVKRLILLYISGPSWIMSRLGQSVREWRLSKDLWWTWIALINWYMSHNHLFSRKTTFNRFNYERLLTVLFRIHLGVNFLRLLTLTPKV